MRLFQLVILITVLFIFALVFVRGRRSLRKRGPEIVPTVLIPLVLIAGLIFVAIGKIAIFFAFLTIAIILLASKVQQR